jgi:tetratricopeptide (TPR) repeat protein
VRRIATAASVNDLALLVKAKGDPATAETLMRDDLAMVRKSAGESHPAYAHALNNLSRTVLDQGRLDEAQMLLEQALRIVALLLPDDDPRRLIYVTNLARADSRTSEAERLLHALQPSSSTRCARALHTSKP